MKKLIPISIILLVIAGCATLSKSQLESIKTYSSAAKEYSSYPSVLVKKYVSVQNDIFILTNSYKANPKRGSDNLFSHYKRREAIMREVENLDLSFKILKEYAKNLVILSTTDYTKKINNNSEKIGTNIDTLISIYNGKFNKQIPVGLGNLVYKSAVLIGKKHIDKKRSESLKKYIEQGNIVIKEFTNTTKIFLENDVKNQWIEGLDEELKNAHFGIRQQIVVDTNNYPSNVYNVLLIDEKVSEIYNEIAYLEKMNSALIKSVDNLYKAHNALYENVKQKQKMSVILKDISSFIKDVYELVEIQNEFKTNEE